MQQAPVQLAVKLADGTRKTLWVLQGNTVPAALRLTEEARDNIDARLAERVHNTRVLMTSMVTR